MRDFEARLPRQQLDLCPPHRAYQHETLLGPTQAHGSAVAHQSRIDDGGTRFLQDLAAEGLLPRLIAFGTTAWPAPSLAIVADQYDTIVGGHTERIGSMGN